MNSLQSDLKIYYDTLINYNDKLITLKKNTSKKLLKNISELFNIVSNQKSGLFYNMNCNNLKKSANTIQNSMCSSFLPMNFKLNVIFILCGILSFFVSIMLYFSESRNNSISSSKNKEINERKNKFRDSLRV